MRGVSIVILGLVHATLFDVFVPLQLICRPLWRGEPISYDLFLVQNRDKMERVYF